MDILKCLHDGKFHSGQALARIFNCSRTAIWKQIKQLEKQGVPIETVKGRGYRIAGGHVLLDSDSVVSLLPEDIASQYHFDLVPIVDSTNKLVSERCKHDTASYICSAEMQQKGRGRRGKAWASPFAQNIYCSFGVTMNQPCMRLSGLSLAVGVRLAAVLRQYGINEIQVKWPNDLFVGDQKIAGILVEVMGDVAGPCEVVIGFGINVNMLYADNDISQPWTSMMKCLGDSVDRNQLLADCIVAIDTCINAYQRKGLSHFIAEWRKVDYLYQKDIVIHQGNETLHGKAQGINQDGLLEVTLDSGKAVSLHSGEVSVRQLG